MTEMERLIDATGAASAAATAAARAFDKFTGPMLRVIHTCEEALNEREWRAYCSLRADGIHALDALVAVQNWPDLSIPAPTTAK